MAVPTIIATKLAELEQLCEKYPTKIPIEECAAFLGMAGESLRACLNMVRVRSDWAGSRKMRTTGHSTFRR